MALDENPVRQSEAARLLEYFDAHQLAELVGVSTHSIARYLRWEQQPPIAVVNRLHWLARAVGYLSGTYNENGVRRWFKRQRKALGGLSPEEVLLAEEEWSSESEGALRVLDLAQASVGMIAT